MKHLVLITVGTWFAFLTVIQSFQSWERLLQANNFSLVAWSIIILCLLPIAFGYTALLVRLYQQPRKWAETVTITLAIGMAVALIFIVMSMQVRSDVPLLLSVYVQIDMYLRTRQETVITYMDYGNTLLLFATCLWWTVTGIVLLLLPQTRRKNV